MPIASQLQLRRGTTPQHAVFTGAPGEVTVDTDKKTVVVHDGSTAGGFPLSRESVIATGSVTRRSISDRFADVKSLKDFGLISSDTLDQTALLQSVLNGLPDNCQINWDCTIKITSTVTVDINGALFLGVNGGGLHMDTKGREDPSPDLGFRVHGNQNRITGLRFINPDRTKKRIALRVHGDRNMVNQCEFKSFADGIQLIHKVSVTDGDELFDNIITNNFVYDVVGGAGLNSRAIHSYGSRTLISNNIVLGAVDVGATDLTHGIKVDGNYIQEIEPIIYGDADDYNLGCVITGNIVSGEFQHGIYAERMIGTIISNNNILGGRLEAITSSANRNCVSGNEIMCPNNGTGIRLFSGSFQSIQNNVIFAQVNNSGSGISVGEFSAGASIKGNVFCPSVKDVQKYSVSGMSGSFDPNDRVISSSGVRSDNQSLTGSTLTVNQVGGYFLAGETVSQAVGGWSATIDASITPNNRLLRGIIILNNNANSVVENNTFNRGSCQTFIRVTGGIGTIVRNNVGYDATVDGEGNVYALSNPKNLVVENNVFRESKSTISIRISGVADTNSIIRNNIVETTGDRGIDQVGGTVESLDNNIVSGASIANISVRSGATVKNVGSATYNPPNLIDGDGATTTVTVTGAALGDYAEASFSLDLQGIAITAWVSAADTVSVRFQNETGGTIDLGSGTLRARVFKP
jgi:hypothetical protein